MISMSLAYLLITIICYSSTDSTALLSPLYFISAYLMISIAELLLSPVGLSAITVLANRKKVSTMMGIFFVSLGIGGFLSGKLAILTAIKPGTLSLLELKAPTMLIVSLYFSTSRGCYGALLHLKSSYKEVIKTFGRVRTRCLLY